ncbi:MAG: hypothetical protein OEY33_01015 [Bdellovibrionales bacterium]|nr:hypothetical protein [Bdellovibrionales bacterium]
MWKATIALLILFYLPQIHSYEIKKYRPIEFRKSAVLLIPDDYQKEEQIPLIVSLHGFIDPGIFINIALPIKSFVDSRKIFALKPFGTRDILLNRFWNTGEWCCNFFQKKINDVEYLKNLILKIKNDFPQIGKVIIMGHSNGAIMSQKMICDHPDIISGVISYAGAGLLKSRNCKTKKEFTYIQINGKKDALIKFEGIKGKYPSFYDQIKNVKAEMDCKKQTQKLLTLKKWESLRNIQVTEYDDCRDQNKMITWVLPKGKHLTVPGKEGLNSLLGYFEI